MSLAEERTQSHARVRGDIIALINANMLSRAGFFCSSPGLRVDVKRRDGPLVQVNAAARDSCL